MHYGWPAKAPVDTNYRGISDLIGLRRFQVVQTVAREWQCSYASDILTTRSLSCEDVRVVFGRLVSSLNL